MHIREKLYMDRDGLTENGPITIVAFGDSVTHGAVGAGEIDYETVYWNRLRQKLNGVRSYVPVNVINAGIGGITAKNSLPRLRRHVLIHEPDLVIVCFGLNDVNGTLEDFSDALRAILGECREAGTDVILMTPNMLNTYVAEGTEARYADYAKKTAEYQTAGRMDRFMGAAAEVAREMGVPLCDCYAKWKKLAETEDTTLLLANRINHPTREMHALFADSLFEIIMGETRETVTDGESTMYRA